MTHLRSVFTRRSWLLLLLIPAACSTAPKRASSSEHASAQAARHPLDPLDDEEVATARSILGRVSGKPISIELDEPTKDELAAWARGETIQRRAEAVVSDRGDGGASRVSVDLRSGDLVHVTTADDAQPMITDEDYAIAEKLVRADERWQAAMRKRGVDDFGAVYLDPWAPGSQPVPVAHGARILRVLSDYKGSQTNEYGPPIEGVVVVVDVQNERVLEVTDTSVTPISRTSTDFYDPSVRGAARTDLKALSIAQPDGASFVVDGHEIRWQRWHVRWSFNAREGLVLHTIGYEDGGRVRPIVHRASISEMWVPYGDPDPNWSWRNAFDEGEYGLGLMANELVAGRDVPPNALVLPGLPHGAVQRAKERVVALYERSGGTMWGHNGESKLAPRARELVIEFVATAGNYDYGFRWIFRQDGSFAFESELTGIMLTKGTANERCAACEAKLGPDGTLIPEGDDRHGTLVADHVVAVNHQHFVCLRLDFDVDGPLNSVRELDVEPDDGSGPGNAFVVRRRELRDEKVAVRDVDATRHRRWEVFNPSSITALGHRAGYTIVPGETAVPYASTSSLERRLAAFADHQLWVTRFHQDERFAAGEFPNQAQVPSGLPDFVRDDESLDAQDVVVWYVLGVTHVPRPEDYPVMPTARAGVSFVPSGFFTRNPALDVP